MSYRIQSVDILRLMQHHLLECGLVESAASIQRESGVGLTASSPSLRSLATAGRWGDVMLSLSRLDEDTRSLLPAALVVEVREMAVLELAESGDLDLARLTMRSCGDSLRENPARRELLDKALNGAATAQREGGRVGDDFYGLGGVSRQTRRDRIGKNLDKYVPTAPTNRLVTLINQALRWEQHTGTLPSTNPADYDDVSSAIVTDFDIVIGAPPPHLVGDGISSDHSSSSDKSPTQQYGVIKFGKSSHPEAAVFLPDGTGLVTAAADGFVEIYDPVTCKLRVSDLPYQASSEFMVHDSPVLSLAHSPDGELLACGTAAGDVNVWGVKSGRCLRSLDKAHPQGVLCLAFSPDGGRVLTGSLDHLSREFGLRVGNLLQEYRGHVGAVRAVDVSGRGSLGAGWGAARRWPRRRAQGPGRVRLRGGGGVGGHPHLQVGEGRRGGLRRRVLVPEGEVPVRRHGGATHVLLRRIDGAARADGGHRRVRLHRDLQPPAQKHRRDVRE